LHLNSMEQCLILRSEKCLILCCYFLLPPLPVIVFHWCYALKNNPVFCCNSSLPDLKGSSKGFPKHETRHLSEHKVCNML
jgi:hypothetical protein